MRGKKTKNEPVFPFLCICQLVVSLSPPPLLSLSLAATIADGHVLYIYRLHDQLRVPGNGESDIQVA